MKQCLLALCLTLLLAWAPSPRASLALLTSHVDGGVAICTAFCIYEEDGMYLTADHCLPAELDGKSVQVRVRDTASGIGVFKAKGRPALKLGKAPKMNDTVTALGYNAVMPIPLQWSGSVQATQFRLWPEAPEMIIIGATTLGGMSGGPILNKDGRVVSLTLMKNEEAPLSAGVDYFQLEQIWRRFGPPQY